VLVLADEALESVDMESVDSRTLITLLLIRDIRDRRRQKILKSEGPEALARLTCRQEPTLLSEILDSKTRNLITLANVSDYVLSNELVRCHFNLSSPLFLHCLFSASQAFFFFLCVFYPRKVSMAIAMVAEQREVNAVLQELFSAEGNEMLVSVIHT